MNQEHNLIDKEYLTWLKTFVFAEGYLNKSYNLLFEALYNKTFKVVLKKDTNRLLDGLDLRRLFVDELNYNEEMATKFCSSKYKPCSVLEVMIALSLRIETDLMGDYIYGDRTSQWFWAMISNLGLGKMDDSAYDEIYVDNVLNIFLNREYDIDGNGSLFFIEGSTNMKDAEIWYQAMWYLDEIFE